MGRLTKMASWVGLGLASTTTAAETPDYYVREQIPTPPGAVMEIGSIALLPDRRVAVGTRRGEVWICEGAYGNDLSQVKWTRFAHGIHEPFGMHWKEGGLQLVQRPEYSRLEDTDGDGVADHYQTLCDTWGINGDYHEYAFGSRPDKDGKVWIALCLTGSIHSTSEWRGWGVTVSQDGVMTPVCSGIRSPGGVGLNHLGDVFYTDNQGFWNGSSSLKWMKPGSFQGNPSGNRWHEKAKLPAPPEPDGPSRIEKEREKFSEFIPPAVVFPHGTVGQSPTGVECDLTGGKFGPWQHQLYVGDQTHAQVQRVCLEKVNGIYQGAVFHFLGGFECGLIPVVMDQQYAVLFVGGSNRGWASLGSRSETFARVRWTGETPFEIRDMKATPDGFRLSLTREVDVTTAGDPASYSMRAWTYIYQSDYGSPEVDEVEPMVTAVVVADDRRSVDLTIAGRVKGHVHHLKAEGLKSAGGKPLRHPEGWYTLNEIPE